MLPLGFLGLVLIFVGGAIFWFQNKVVGSVLLSIGSLFSGIDGLASDHEYLGVFMLFLALWWAISAYVEYKKSKDNSDSV